jgi:hypothetical protein
VKALFSVAISATALLLLIGLARRHAAMRAGLGGGWCYLSVIVITLGTNISIAAFPGRTSYPLGIAALLFFACACAASRMNDVIGGSDRWQRAAWWIYGTILAWCFTVDVVVGAGVVGERWITYAAAGVVWLGTGLLAGTMQLQPVGIAYAAAALLGSMSLPTVVVPAFWTPCNEQFDKCSPAGELFRSFASSENYVAVVAAFVLVGATVALRGGLRVLAILNAAVVLAASGSRTGLVAVVAALGAVAVLGLLRHWRRPVARMSKRACFCAAASAVVTAVWLIFSAEPQTLSKRGSIWLAVRGHVEGHLLEGVGVSKWSYYQGIGESPQHYFHSSYALALFAGGLVAVALIGAWCFCIVRSARGVGNVAVVAPLVVLLVVDSLTEVIWNPLAVDGLTWLVVVMGCATWAGPVVGARGALQHTGAHV